jgi:RNA-directed DNA polymerase
MSRPGSSTGFKDIREVIFRLNPVLRGWGNYFRTGNAADKFQQIDKYVEERLGRLLMCRSGKNLSRCRSLRRNREWLEAHGLYRLRGTIRYPEAA